MTSSVGPEAWVPGCGSQKLLNQGFSSGAAMVVPAVDSGRALPIHPIPRGGSSLTRAPPESSFFG